MPTLKMTAKHLIAASMFALVAAPASAQLLPVEQPETETGQPTESEYAGHGRLVLVNSALDIGELLDTETGELNFEFRNIGAGPLTITGVKPSCGCTVPDLEKTVYAPNETGTIHVKFDPKGKRGDVVQTVRVFTDSTDTEVTTLTLRAHVKPVVVLEPNAVLNFMSVEKGIEQTKDITVMGRFSDFEVTRVTTDDPVNFSVEVIPGEQVEVEGEKLFSQILRVTLKGDAAPGQLRTELSIRTNDERKPIFSMSAVARVMGDLQFAPARMTLGRMVVGDEFDREIRITSRSGAPFEIKGVTLSNTTVDASFTYEPVDPENKTEWVITAKGSVLHPAARFNTVVNVLTDVKGEEMLPLRMYGQLRPKP